ADHGPGLRPGEERRVFEKFYRGSANSARPGAGLGLAICESIVRAHGGRMSAANRREGGAVFTAWLPLEGDPPAIEDESDSGAIGLDSLVTEPAAIGRESTEARARRQAP